MEFLPFDLQREPPPESKCADAGMLPFHVAESNGGSGSVGGASVQVVTGPTPWQGGLVAISSFGFGGSNVHAIIAGCVRPKGPPPRALPAPQPLEAPEAVEGGDTVIQEVQDEEPLFPPEVIPSAGRLNSVRGISASQQFALQRC